MTKAVHRLSRRALLALTAKSFGAAAMLGGPGAALTAFAQPAREGAPSTGLLKRRIKSRTFNVHTHITGIPGSIAAANLPRTEIKPFDPQMPITEQDRSEAIKYWSRFKHGVLEFDSKEQEDLYVRKYVHNRRYPRRGTFENQAERFRQEMDEAGIDTAVLLELDFMRPMTTVSEGDPNGERIEPMLRATQKLCEKRPGRFVPFAAIDVRRGKEGVKLFEKAVKQYGFKGYGELVGTLWQTKPNNRELCYPFYEKALELGVPVMIDATMDRGFSETQIFEEILKDFPKLKICAGGAGIRVNPVEQNGLTVSAPDRMLQLAEKHENLFLDLDDWQVANQKGIRKYLDFLRRALNGPARNRIMFGSDFPVFEWMYTEKEWIEFILKHVDKREIKFSEQELPSRSCNVKPAQCRSRRNVSLIRLSWSKSLTAIRH